MAARAGGVILNVTSVHEHQPRPGYAAHCTAKAGLGMLTKVLARELAPYGIRALAVAPGAIETPIQGGHRRRRRGSRARGLVVLSSGARAGVAQKRLSAMWAVMAEHSVPSSVRRTTSTGKTASPRWATDSRMPSSSPPKRAVATTAPVAIAR